MSKSEEIHDHDRGLAYDLPRLISRRRALGVLATSVGATALAACGSGPDPSTSASPTTSTGGDGSPSEAGGGDAVPEETAGPFPADGSNGPNALTQSGVVRRDITTSFGDSSGSAGGVPTSIDMRLIDVAGGGGPLAGAAVYLWHCDRDGRYSIYDPEISDQNYLRGVQASDDAGKLSFASIFPAAYSGRWPHIHFEVYESAEAAASATSKLRTSQIALPEDVCDLVYATGGYEQSAQNLSAVSLDTDMVFSDGYSSQLASWSGDPDRGIDLSLNVGV